MLNNFSYNQNVNSVKTVDIIKWELVNSPMNESDIIISIHFNE